MEAGLLVQYLVIALAVTISAAFVAKKQFPAGVRRLRIACAIPLVRNGRAAWLQRVGRWVAPAPNPGEGSCGGCHSCDTGKS
ncbi:DUF6587 family protein [Lysobacter solisilvae (ex Woo and Kim 2020)]|uniref:Uncharacterized protein n=1 Tax=Agrilutibacter terrestris TaxID=2865112 RepID=A0A7H0FWT1_9GAMM|nr:DUF6587 family protein [Lysobacter terrestris]QNP40497.1 hypothetical protein H8B22_13660 [Lysobacter terrestris]